MRALLDVNVLIALLDANHVGHAVARDWLIRNATLGWASCPITQNGCVRILSAPKYPNATSVQDAIRRLTQATASPTHAFWPDSVSLFAPGLVNWDRALTSRTITDAYLLALAVKNKGRLVTFDRGITTQFVDGAAQENLVILQP
jgi:uncharacterized protein